MMRELLARVECVAVLSVTTTAIAFVPAAASTPAPTVSVIVVNAAEVPAPTVQHALDVAGATYHRAGIRLQWVDEIDRRGDRETLTVTLLPDQASAGFPIELDAMGSTRSGEDGRRGRDAYVFLDRARAFATAGPAAAWIVLGYAIAHELGHLLLPIHAHTQEGIMRGDWYPGFVPRTGAGVLNFSSEQAQLMRARLATREP